MEQSSRSSPPASSSSPPLDSSLDPKDAEILLLRQRLDRLECLIADKFHQDSDPAIKTQAPLQYYHPSDAEVSRCPSIKPATPLEFFTKPPKSDAELMKDIRSFPKNVYMDQYKAPKVPSVVSNNLNYNKKHDSQLRELQERCAELTRPVHFYFHQFHQLQKIDPENLKPDQILDLAVNFAVLMSQQLGGMAVKMQEIRMANVREAAGAHFEDGYTKSIRTFKNKSGTDNPPRQRKQRQLQNNNNSHGSSP